MTREQGSPNTGHSDRMDVTGSAFERPSLDVGDNGEITVVGIKKITHALIANKEFGKSSPLAQF